MSQNENRKSRWLRAPTIGLVAVTAALFGLPLAAQADSEADNLEFIIVSDDIRKQVSNVARPDGSEPSPAAPSGEGGSTDGNPNHGHGNNADGVDSSNPGQGKGGPNGAEDPSDGVDDEAGGGGAAPSKSKGKK